MRREIKFRAWVNDQWVDFMPVVKTFGEYNESVIDTDGYTFEETNPFIVEQYTGLKDKNGKEIYEGDIVTLSGECEEIEKDDCKVITFKDGCFRIGDDYENEAGIYLSDWRVIGNIHDNPELLGGEE